MTMLLEEVRNSALAATWKGMQEHPGENVQTVAEGIVGKLTEEEKTGLCVLAIVKIAGAVEQTRLSIANML